MHVAKTSRPETELALIIGASKASESINCSMQHGGKPLHDMAARIAKLDWNFGNAPDLNGFSYRLRAYEAFQPGWQEDFRARVEHDMSLLPDHNQKWLDVRIELDKGQVRFWLDDRLMAQKTDPAIVPEGAVQIYLSSGAQLASYRLSELKDSPAGFLPVRLGGYANGRNFMENASVAPASLPPADAPVLVENIPFLFPGVNCEGKDHLDIGQSLYRQANEEGYSMALGPIWSGSAMRDPARIQIRVPNGQFDRLYVVAAADNKPDSLPTFSAMFFRPEAGFAESFEGKIPLAAAESSSAKPLPVRLSDGRQVKLWLVEVPLDPGRLTPLPI